MTIKEILDWVSRQSEYVNRNTLKGMLEALVEENKRVVEPAKKVAPVAPKTATTKTTTKPAATVVKEEDK